MTSTVLSDAFTDDRGRWRNYTAYDAAEAETLRSQAHRDIRSFRPNDITIPLTVLDLNTYTMAELDALTVQEIQDLSTVVEDDENWVNESGDPLPVAAQSDRAHTNALVFTAPGDGTQAISVMTKRPIDLVTGFASTDAISLAMPSFPLPTTNLAATYLDFTSHPEGDFVAGPTASVAFSASTVALLNGDSQFRVPRSAFEGQGADLSRITGVRIRIGGTGTYRFSGLRIFDPAWRFVPLEVDTRNGVLRRNIALNGADQYGDEFTQPIAWRSNEPPGDLDPRPINTKVGATIFTGIAQRWNFLEFYFREGSRDYVTQLDLNGMTMEELNALGAQPDTAEALYIGRTQDELDQYTQEELDQERQEDLERVTDPEQASWIRAYVSWGSTTTEVIEIADSEGNMYSWGLPAFAQDTFYLAVVEIVETSARVIIYELDDTGRIASTFFDTGVIFDSFHFKRRQGRFGWKAQLLDGDAYIDSILTRGMVFAEYRSRPLESITPVEGVELFAAGSPARDLFAGFSLYNNSGDTTLTRDRNRTVTGESWKITNPGSMPAQGVISNVLSFTDFANAEILFDIYFPHTAHGADLTAYLQSARGGLIPLIMERHVHDQWHSHRVVITDPDIPTGDYRLVIIQTSAGTPTTWWIDNVHVHERTLRWQARIADDDPWVQEDRGWVDFRENLNRESGGILFGKRGNRVQVRTQALRQDSFVNQIKFRPKYAQLGRLVDLTAANNSLPPSPLITATPTTGTTMRFDGQNTIEDGYIVLHEWTFGDGEVGYGAVVDHTYPTTGVYTVTLTVVDNHGNRRTINQAVTV